MQAHTEEGDNYKTSGPHLEINDSCTVCDLLKTSTVHVALRCTFALDQQFPNFFRLQHSFKAKSFVIATCAPNFHNMHVCTLMLIGYNSFVTFYQYCVK